MKAQKVIIPYFGETGKAIDLRAISEFIALVKAGKIDGFILAYKEKDGECWDHVVTHSSMNETRDAATLNLLLDCMKHDLLSFESRRSATAEVKDDDR